MENMNSYTFIDELSGMSEIVEVGASRSNSDDSAVDRDDLKDVNEELDIYESKISDMGNDIELIFEQNKQLWDEMDRKVAERKKSEKKLKAKIDELTYELNNERIISGQLQTRLNILEARISSLEANQIAPKNDQPFIVKIDQGGKLGKDGPDPDAITVETPT